MKSFTRSPSRRATIAIGAAGLAVAGAVGIGTAAFADGTPSPGSSQPAGTTSTTAAAAPVGAPIGAPTGAPTGPAGGPGGTHAPHIGGTVRSVSGSTVTVTDRDGFTRTVRLSDSATVTKSGSDSSASAITTGTWIEATGTVDANGTTLDATAITIGRPTPPAGGRAGEHGPLRTPPAGAPTPPAAPSAPPADAEPTPAAPTPGG